MNVLTSGYPTNSESFDTQCKEECFGESILQTSNCSCNVSNQLSRQLPKGVSHCKVDDEIRKLSFVVVAGQGFVRSVDNNPLPDSDSRGCRLYSGTFINPEIKSHRNIQGMIPAYLIVLNI